MTKLRADLLLGLLPGLSMILPTDPLQLASCEDQLGKLGLFNVKHTFLLIHLVQETLIFKWNSHLYLRTTLEENKNNPSSHLKYIHMQPLPYLLGYLLFLEYIYYAYFKAIFLLL